MTLAEKLESWLDEIGADGLMVNMSSSDHVYLIGSELERAIESWGLDSLVPAFRHADVTYHVEPDSTKPCDSCVKEDCISEMAESCQVYLKWKKRWLAHKEAAK